jgi:hypothetical protein
MKQRDVVRGRNLVFRDASFLPHSPIVRKFLYSLYLSRAKLCLEYSIHPFPVFVNILIRTVKACGIDNYIIQKHIIHASSFGSV